MNDVTRILSQIEQGDRQAAEQLLPLVYDELRKLAAARMAHEGAGHTLQPTALVHEAWLRLTDNDPNTQAGQLLGFMERTAKRHWAFARAWLYDAMKNALNS